MNKIIITALLALGLVTGAHANEITIINGGSAASSTTASHFAIKEYLVSKGYKVNIESVEGCNRVPSLWNNLKTTTITLQSTADKPHCHVPIDDSVRTIMSHSGYDVFCGKVGITAEDLFKSTKEFKVGVVTVDNKPQLYDAIVKASSAKLKFIPYRGSSEMLSALIANEIDISTSNPTQSLAREREGKISCFLTLETTHDRFATMQKYVPDYDYSKPQYFSVLAVKHSNTKLLEDLDNYFESPTLRNFRYLSGMTRPTYLTESQAKQLFKELVKY